MTTTQPDDVRIDATPDTGRITVISPYDPDFVRRAKNLGGAWGGDNTGWMFTPRDHERVVELVRGIYGSDGSDNDEARVIVRIPLDSWDPGSRDAHEFRLAGRRLAGRRSRDERVRLSPNVVLIAGGFPNSGGSMRYPELCPNKGTVIEVREVTRLAAEKMLQEYPAAEIIDGQAEARAALLAEADRLRARLAEIDALLAKGILSPQTDQDT